MMEDHEDILASPLILQNHSINTSNNDELKAAFDLLMTQSSAVLTYEYVITSLRSQRYLDQADMALAYSGDQQVLNEVDRSEEHTSELQSLMRTPYAVFCLNKKKTD